MKISDKIFGVALILFAVCILIYSRFLPSLPGYAYGSGFFPSFTAVFILGGGCALVWRGIGSKMPLIILGEWTKSPLLVANICIIPLSLVFYILVSDKLGFLLTAFIMMFTTIWWLRRKIVSTLLISCLSAIVIYVFFAKLMLVPLPMGVLGI
jgi:putative tricarboxylic transport membrane protein